MSDKLIFNPFLEVHIDSDREADFLLFAPKKESGLQILRINQQTNDKLHKLIATYSKIGLQYIDINEDLDSTEIELFKQFAVLINENKKVEKILFACQLDEVGEPKSDFDNYDDIIVNPTFRFEPMNLSEFKEWIFHKHLSPKQARVWIENPVTKIEIGYWLNQKEMEIVSNLIAGAKLPSNIDKNIFNKLLATQILVSKSNLKNETEYWKKVVKNAQLHFQTNRYILVENLLPKPQIKSLKYFYRNYISQGFMEFGDEFVHRRFRQHNEPLAKQFHKNFTGLMSQIVGETVVPTYCYAACYIEDAELAPHLDRKDCEYSISFQVDYFPEIEDKKSPWALHLAFPEEEFEQETAFTWDEFNKSSNLSKGKIGLNLEKW